VQEQSSSQRHLLNIGLLYALSTFTTASQGAVNLILPLHLDALGHSLPVIGLTVGLISVGSLISRLPGGAWYRQSRGRALSAASLVAMSLTMVGLGLTERLPLQAALAIVQGVAFGLSTTFVLALLIELCARDSNAGAIIGWYTAAISCGYAISGPLAVWSIEQFGYGPAFFVAGLVSLAGGLAALGLRIPAQATPAPTPTHRRRPALAHGLRTLAALPPGVWLATLLGFYVNFVADTYGAFHPLYALSIGIPLATIGFWKAVHSITSTVVRFISGWLLSYVSLNLVSHVIVITMAASTAALAFVTQLGALTVLYAVLGLCRGMLRVTSATMLAEERRRGQVSIGLASGVYNSGLDLGSLLGPPIAGALAGAFGIPATSASWPWRCRRSSTGSGSASVGGRRCRFQALEGVAFHGDAEKELDRSTGCHPERSEGSVSSGRGGRILS
jgi:MFS family permease